MPPDLAARRIRWTDIPARGAQITPVKHTSYQSALRAGAAAS